jgi:hypothetical protein
VAVAKSLLIAFCAGALAGAAAAATAENPEYKPVPADMAAARASTLKAADLGAAWKGGQRKPDRPTGIVCAGFAPKQADLVVTGIADAEFRHTVMDVESQIQVLKTADMVRTDFARTVQPPMARCLATRFEQGAGGAAKVVSARRISFPRLGTVSAAYRLVVDVTAQGQTVRILLDFVAIGVRRTEISLILTAPASAQATVTAVGRRLAGILAARARA